MSQHQRVPLEGKPIEFENCTEHPNRKNEFYCYCCQQVYCSECVLNGLSKAGENNKQHNLIPIETAYNNALSEAKNSDVGLDDKKKLIVEQIGNI